MKYKFCFLSLAFFGLIACNNPIENEYQTKVAPAEVIFKLDDYTAVNDLSASPVENKLALNTQKIEFDLFQIKNGQIDDEKAFAENIFDIKYGERPVLAPGSAKLAGYRNNQISILNISNQTLQSFEFNNNKFKNLKWTNLDRYLLSLFYDSENSIYFIYNLDLITNTKNLIHTESSRKILKFDCCPQSEILYFFGCYGEISYKNYIYFFDMNNGQLDSTAVSNYVKNISISNNGDRVVWVEDAGDYTSVVKVFNSSTGQFEVDLILDGLLTYPQWNHDDSKILFSGTEGYSIYSFDGGGLSHFSVSSAIQGDHLEKVWGKEEGDIYFIRKADAFRLSIYDVDNDRLRQCRRLLNSEIFSPVWSPDGKKLAYINNSKIYFISFDTDNEKEITVPFSYSLPIVRFGPDEQWLTFVEHSVNGNKFILYQYSTKEKIEIDIDSTFSSLVGDFSYTKRSNLAAFVFPEVKNLHIYDFDGSSLHIKEKITLDICSIRWAPASSPLIEAIGEYAVFQGSETLGIYFLEKNYPNWIKHLDINKASKYDWSFDAKSLYYTGSANNIDKNIYLEEVVFSNN
jgi:Tol biopolymer transport system component